MRDIDIRNVLLSSLHKKHKTEADTLIVQELGICQGEARIDIAVVNGSIHGYEIKSDKDSLNRLPGQQTFYNRVFDYVTIVSSQRHLDKIYDMVPTWWGLDKIVQKKDKFEIVKVRHYKANKNIDVHALIQLLWRDEALDVLREHNLHRGHVKKPRKVLWQIIIDNFPPSRIQKMVRERIKRRGNWRFP